jgi:TolB-like protein
VSEEGRPEKEAAGQETAAETPRSRLSEFFAELRRRRVFRALVVYAVASFAVLQVAEPVMHGLHLPDWVLSLIVVFLVLGFPLTVGLAWAFDLRTTGVERTRPAEAHPDGPPRSRVRLWLLLAGVAAGGGAVFALRWWLRSPPLPPSIAVLPFADMSPGKDQEYLSDGIAEEILITLSRVDGLRVAGRTSSFYFKGRNAKLADIRRELNVTSVLEGGVRRDGNRVRVTATIVNVADGFHAWSESWDRDVKDILAVESEIAHEVVEALKVRLLGGRRPTVPEPPRTTAEAHLHVLQGRQAFQRGSVADWARAVEAYERAVKADPGLSSAWAGLALALADYAQSRPTLEGLLAEKRRALEAADRAVVVGSAVPEAYVARGPLRGLHRGEWAEAQADVEKAMSLGGGGDAYAAYARVLGASSGGSSGPPSGSTREWPWSPTARSCGASAATPATRPSSGR